ILLLFFMSVLLLPFVDGRCTPNGFEMDDDLAYPKLCIRITTLKKGVVSISEPRNTFVPRAQYNAAKMQRASRKINCVQGSAHEVVFGCTTYDCFERRTISHADLVECGLDVPDYAKIVWHVFVCVWPVLIAIVSIVVYKRQVFPRIWQANRKFQSQLAAVEKREKFNKEFEQKRAAIAESKRLEEAAAKAAAEQYA
ncbi:hypothetical protein PFISCL1PPCAC_2745, partial [Pristionchus fissidentatus]